MIELALVRLKVGGLQGRWRLHGAVLLQVGSNIGIDSRYRDRLLIIIAGVGRICYKHTTLVPTICFKRVLTGDIINMCPCGTMYTIYGANSLWRRVHVLNFVASRSVKVDYR